MTTTHRLPFPGGSLLLLPGFCFTAERDPADHTWSVQALGYDAVGVPNWIEVEDMLTDMIMTLAKTRATVVVDGVIHSQAPINGPPEL